MTTKDNEWRARLTTEQYAVLREQATEKPFSGELLHNHRVGDYLCAGCQQRLFLSDTKFDSGSGWPSFYDVASPEAVKLVEDRSDNSVRVEVSCSRCGGHLGHVFNDAPEQPTGMRFCINSTALEFAEKS